ncbi:Aste57867_11519 [Aphanomyces stellatus]|uniref:Aste57867_11519 protein n=1 Tax=Aphanomyces stellatus TaxID=120398 RepID=A0A485KTS4_9STRA|nr:hypothetical protein As57867_011476 [Aphanomyces stellatus]VFT88380.1 Aste57867_11519 [Aphanomyces stellatus]
MIAPALNEASLQSHLPKSVSTFERLEVCGGVLYIFWTISLSVWFLALLEPSLSNNHYWPHYNLSGYGGLLVDLVNLKLKTARNGSVDLTASDLVMHKTYSQSLVPLTFHPAYARHVLFTELNTLTRAIHDLRNTTFADKVYAQYCWLDFDRRWDVAHTARRSARCAKYYTDNAANYIETLVRNTDWSSFMALASDLWHVAFVVELQQTDEGLKWLADRPVDSLHLGVDDEVAYLTSLGLTRYDLQWQNDIDVAITETLVVENALGISQPTTIKASSSVFGTWTSLILFWNFHNDLFMCQCFNVSLIRSADNSLDNMGLAVSSMVGLQDSNDDFVQQAHVFLNELGPFVSIDTNIVAVPPPQLAMYTAFRSNLYQTLWSKSKFLDAFQTIPSFALTPLPPNFASPNLTFFGGNVLCLFNAPTAFPQTMVSFDDACATQSQFTIVASNEAMLFALLFSGTTQISSICAFQSTRGCVQALTQAQLALAHMDLLDDVRSPMLLDSMPPLQFVQYAQDDLANWLLLQQPLLTADPAWSFFGWLAIYDWIQGTREVLRLEGDVATLVLISEAYPNVALGRGSDSSASIGDTKMVYFLLVYVTLTLSVVVTAVLVYAALERFSIAGRNLLQFNRVAGLVWIGRPLLLLRGLTAALVLSTSQVQLTTQGTYSKFEFTARSIFATIVVVGESTWITYVVSDTLLLVTGRRRSKFAAPMASGLAWLIGFWLEVTSPVRMTAHVDRQCTVRNTDKVLTCHSGVVQVGDWNRMVLLVLVHAGCAVLSLVAGVWNHDTRNGSDVTSLLLHGSAQAFLNSRQQSDVCHLDNTACVMSGLIPWSFRSQTFTFDINLWVILQETTIADRVGSVVSFKMSKFGTAVKTRPAKIFPSESSTLQTAVVAAHAPKWWSRLKVLAGLGYIVLTALGSVSYIALSTVNFANDFFWATFNITGHHVAMADWFNEQVSLGRNLSLIRLDEPRWAATEGDFSSPSAHVSSSPFIPPKLQFETLNTLPVTIRSLRTTDPCSIPWVFTQYCWLDFNRQWSVANSDARQLRCYNDISNGALYLESALRNIDWNIWTSCWGTSFDIAFGNELHKSRTGQNWVASVQNSNTLSVDDEVVYWTNAGIQHYTVQWQNYKTTGLINTYMIENAFGVQYPMTLSHSNGSYRFASQTTFQMYWGLASDLWAVSQNTTLVGGLSLIRSSGSYAFANMSMVELMVENGTAITPFGAAFTLVQSSIGPFGTIDMNNIPCPISVKRFVASALDVLRRTLADNPIVAASYGMISNSDLANLKPFPSIFLKVLDWLVVGGSILCPEFGVGGYLWSGMVAITGRTTVCGQNINTVVVPTKSNVIVAAMAAGLSRPNQNITAVCVHEANPELCATRYFGPSAALVQEYIAPSDIAALQPLTTMAEVDVWRLNATIFQYVHLNSTSPLRMLQYTLFDPSDPTYTFWAWLHVLEWALGQREVVRFEGDAGYIHLITEVQQPFRQDVQAHEFPTTFALYIRSGVQYVTGIMLAIAVGIVLYILASEGSVEATNLMKMNRVAGIVWVGRPLLLLRGVTALALLSTGTLELYLKYGFLSSFRVIAVPWYKTILAAGETTWLVYIANDIVMVWTKQFTSAYASKSSLLTWLVAAILTLVKPVVHHATIHPICQVDQMDLQLVCASGVVAIGQVSRFYWLLGIITTSNVLCYSIVHVVHRGLAKESTDDNSLLLSAGAKYLFLRTGWLHDNIYYMDSASALMNGLVSFRWRQTIYVFDIKLWRAFAIDEGIQVNLPRQLRSAVALTE